MLASSTLYLKYLIDAKVLAVRGCSMEQPYIRAGLFTITFGRGHCP